MSDDPTKSERVKTLREKCKLLSVQELQALVEAFKRRTGDISEEMQVLQDHLKRRLAAIADLERRYPK